MGSFFDFNHLCYGGDYNPEQWMDTPEIWDEDIRLMKLAGVNAVSLGIFSWVSIEKEEGVYDFTWMDTIIDKLSDNGISVILATPSGARPAWMSVKYPEVLRVSEQGIRNLHGGRHNHCWSSPVYREKTAAINEALSRRYGKHPAVIMWHISNEYGGACYCPTCKAAFRDWLKERYGNDLHKLNSKWWTAFWSHTYTDWDEIDPPSRIGEVSVHGLTLDWQRFVTDQTIDFFDMEVAAVRKYSDRPVTANFMQNEETDYCKFAKHVDVVTWDNYPRWHAGDVSMADVASRAAFFHDRFRAMGGKPFLMLESTPSNTNWQMINKLKRPGMNVLSSIQAVAHGSDGVMYFQWRKSRGSTEKFHGAVVDHEGTENTRVFREAAKLGSMLKQCSSLKGACTPAKAAIIWDYETGWAIKSAAGFRKDRKDYQDTCVNCYQALWKQGIPVDVIDKDADLTPYTLVAAPMLYILPQKTADSLRAFVEKGGTLVATYLTGYVDEEDLCHLGGFPGLLGDVFGIWNEEIDALYDTDVQSLRYGGYKYPIKEMCEIIHEKSAKVLARYEHDFYQDMPVLTANEYGKGKAYYIAARTDQAFLNVFFSDVASQCGLTREIHNASDGVNVQIREKDGKEYVFLLNFSADDGFAELERDYTNLLTGAAEQAGRRGLQPYDCVILVRNSD